MDTRLDLSSAWAKFHRAEEHINTFEAEAAAWLNLKPYRVTIEHNVDFSCYWATIQTIHIPNLERWSLVIGDAVHNLRCALDHLVYAIAIFRTQMNPPPRKKKWFFPIRYDVASFQSALTDHKIAKLGTAVCKEIERFQPYNRRHDTLPPLLGILRIFDDSDKHRLLQIVMVQNWGNGWDWAWTPSDLMPLMKHYRSEVVDGTKISELVFPSPSQDADPKFAANLVISVPPFVLGVKKPPEIAEVLPELAGEVRLIIESVRGVV